MLGVLVWRALFSVRGPTVLRALVLDVAVEPVEGTVADGDPSVLPALALPNEEHAALGVDVEELEPHQLALPQPR